MAKLFQEIIPLIPLLLLPMFLLTVAPWSILLNSNDFMIRFPSESEVFITVVTTSMPGSIQ